jgi:hypothetical protein
MISYRPSIHRPIEATMILSAVAALGWAAAVASAANASDFHNGSIAVDVAAAVRMQPTGSYSP